MRYFLVFWLFFAASLKAEIREITQIAEIFSEVRDDSILLLDIDETLIESSIMLGGKAWRDYAIDLLKKVHSTQKVREVYDRLSHWIVNRVPCVAVESSTQNFLQELQENRIPVFGFTARSRDQWHSVVTDGEALTISHLRQAGFDLETFSEHGFLSHHTFARGVFFLSLKDKGQAALEIFRDAQPAHILFVDDKMDNVQSMDLALAKLGIPAICFYYRHVELYRSFDPLIAAIQLENLHQNQFLLTDNEAALMKEEYAHRTPDLIFLELVDRIQQDCYDNHS